MNGKMRFATLLVGCLGLAAGVAICWRTVSHRNVLSSTIDRDGHAMDRNSHATDRRIDELEQQLVSVKTNLTRLRRDRPEEPLEEEGSAPEESSTSVLDGLTPSEHDELLVRTSVQTYGARLKGEAREEPWASEREDAIAQAVKTLKTSTLQEATCGSTICRATISHESDEESRSELRRIIGSAPFNTSCFGTPTDAGNGTILYCSREGTKLAPVDLAKALAIGL